jgi:hypothetical protein
MGQRPFRPWPGLVLHARRAGGEDHQGGGRRGREVRANWSYAERGQSERAEWLKFPGGGPVWCQLMNFHFPQIWGHFALRQLLIAPGHV